MMQFNKNYAHNRGSNSDFIKRLENSKVTVVGMARAGIAAAHLLNNVGAEVTVTDCKNETELRQELQKLKTLGVKTEFGRHSRKTFTNCDLVITSPGVPYSHSLVKESLDAGIPVMSEIELAYHYFPGKIIAVTGTNGKTTTATLIGECLEANGTPAVICGNIGYPMAEAVLGISRETVVVSEISSFQLERIIFFRPDIALLLNISPDHMDRYRSMDEYTMFKYRITENQSDEDYFIANMEDPASCVPGENTRASVWFFSSESPVKRGTFVRDGELFFKITSRMTAPTRKQHYFHWR